MSRIVGFAVGALWLVFTFMALRAAAAGAAAGQADVRFWYSVIGFFLAVAATVAIVGTVRHRSSGPQK